tara:strand:- start:7783 stop:8934 length:1152 start_codon:yes stop_codon:yes gene_type:complete
MKGKINILVYGATGSIGDSLFSIIRKNKNRFNVKGITCFRNTKKLIKLAKEFNVKSLGSDCGYLDNYNLNKKFSYQGINNFKKMITDQVDVIIFAISGLDALGLSIEIAKSGKKVGLANKECIISLGRRFISIAKKNNTDIVPLDSEHNSIYRLIKNVKSNFTSITITASGGPFLNKDKKYLKTVTPKQAIRHPIWKMGRKISVDSATLMNKALEIIEAKYLFNLKTEKINAVLHPESIIHASINYKDGSSICLLSEPDMKISISSLFDNISTDALKKNIFENLKTKNLNLSKISKKKYPAINLVYKVLKIGGIAPHLFNYNNEILVKKFLQKEIKFLDIVLFNEKTINKYFKKFNNTHNPSISEINKSCEWVNNNIYLGKRN